MECDGCSGCQQRVLDRVGPTLYSQPSANVSYYGGFDIARFLYMKYTQRF